MSDALKSPTPQPVRAPLAGVRVIDLSRVLAGPMAAQILGDFGAEVIKVERPIAGDDARRSSLVALPGPDGKPSAESAMFLCANRNKRSITVDLSRKEGQHLVRELVRKSDIVLENYKVGSLAQYGLDYDTLSKLNPRLIYCSVTGYGQTGPYAERPGYDPVFQAQCGMMSITGYPDDVPGGMPVKTGPHVIDMAGAHYAAMGMMAALRERDHSGLGQHVDIGLLDCGFAVMANTMQHYQISGDVPQRYGNGIASSAPVDILQCADGGVFVVAGFDAHFAGLCKTLGVEALTQDERFRSMRARAANRNALLRHLNEAARSRNALSVLEAMSAAGVPAGPVNDIGQALADPQVVFRQLAQPLPHPLDKDLRVIANPARLSRTPVAYDQAPPLLGQHTRDVLGGLLEMQGKDIDALAEAGVI